MSIKSKIENRKEEILDLYKKKACNVSAVCSALNITRKTFYDYINSDKIFAELIEDAKETLIDNAESILHKKILAEDTVSLLFFLKTIGKKRGYTEKQEYQMSYEPDLSGLSTIEILKILEDERKENSSN